MYRLNLMNVLIECIDWVSIACNQCIDWMIECIPSFQSFTRFNRSIVSIVSIVQSFNRSIVSIMFNHVQSFQSFQSCSIMFNRFNRFNHVQSCSIVSIVSIVLHSWPHVARLVLYFWTNYFSRLRCFSHSSCCIQRQFLSYYVSSTKMQQVHGNQCPLRC